MREAERPNVARRPPWTSPPWCQTRNTYVSRVTVHVVHQLKHKCEVEVEIQVEVEVEVEVDGVGVTIT